MREIHDQIAKAIMRASVGHVARLEVNREIPGNVLAADLWIEPDPARADGLGELGVLGRMVGLGPCLVEPFSGAPRASEIRSCILKQYSLDHAQRRDARTQKKAAPPFPRLWIIASGSPDSVVEPMELRPMQDWPQGFFCGRPFDPFHLVVVRKLPRSPETMFIRLLGQKGTFGDALQDLARVPATLPELKGLASRLMHVLVVFGKEVDQDQLEEDDMEALRDIDNAHEEWLRQIEADADRKANYKMIRKLCEHFGIELTAERQAEMAAWTPEELMQAVVKISDSHEWPQLRRDR